MIWITKIVNTQNLQFIYIDEEFKKSCPFWEGLVTVRSGLWVAECISAPGRGRPAPQPRVSWIWTVEGSARRTRRHSHAKVEPPGVQLSRTIGYTAHVATPPSACLSVCLEPHPARQKVPTPRGYTPSGRHSEPVSKSVSFYLSDTSLKVN